MTLYPVVRCELPDGTLSHWWTAPVASLEAGEVAIRVACGKGLRIPIRRRAGADDAA